MLRPEYMSNEDVLVMCGFYKRAVAGIKRSEQIVRKAHNE